MPARQGVPQFSQSVRPQVKEQDWRATLDAAVRDSLRPVSLGLGALFAVLAVGHAMVLPRAVAPTMITLAVGTAAALLGLWMVLGLWSVPLRWAHPIGAAIAGLVLLNSLVHLYLVPEPQQTTNLLLLIVGAGLFFLSARWLALIVAAALAGWAVVVRLSSPTPEWLYLGFALFIATALSILAHTVRVGTLRRLNLLRLEEELQRQELQAALAMSDEGRQLAETLHSVGRALTGTLDLTRVLDLVLERLAEIVSYDRSSVMLVSGDEMEIVAAKGFPRLTQPRQIRVALRGEDNDLFRQIYLTQKPLSIPDVSQRTDWQYVDGLPQACSWLGVPLIRSNVVIGMLSLTRETLRPYNADEVTLATAFAGQAAIALENARLYDRITRAYEQLESLDRTKSDFIEIASHELRTPLTVLRASSQILLNDPTVKANLDHLELVSSIYSGAIRLHEIVESMLDMAKIDSRALRLDPKPLSMPTLLQTVCSGFAKPLTERHLTLTIQDMNGLEVMADLDALRKVFYHLIVNAIKYTPDGGTITLSGRPLASGQESLSDGGVEIVVSDTGIGIDPRFQEAIFQKFYQTGQVALHSSSRTKFKGGGPGLGLTIARGIVQAHGGRLWAESPGYDEENCPGSRFHVILPLRPSLRPDGYQAQPSALDF